ncbi:MAG TPA: RDD family protein [Terracidiphilus sp.]|nr:RDD family protein [Terracidiphilus sp.]
MSRRLAAHKSRKVQTGPDEDATKVPHLAKSGRAAQAAARVAARYAQAPSFSEMHAAEARVALRAAETATRAALEAQVVAQEALFQMESAAAREQAEALERAEAEAYPQEEMSEFAAESEPGQAMDPAEVPIVRARQEGLEIRWEPDMPARPTAPAEAYAHRETEASEWHDWRRSQRFEDERALAPVEPAQPIHANLIEFPRELVATRRMRPRISGADPNATGELFGQLSIFEVDPTTVATVPAEAAAEAAAPLPEWNEPGWSTIELDEQPEEAERAETEARVEMPALERAPLGLRLLAALVDGSLVVGATCGAALWAAQHMQHAPTMKMAEAGGLGALAGIGALYFAVALLLAGTTPGMRYADLELRDFENERLSRTQVRGRLLAMAVSMLPMGLGLVWAVFDDDHLSWHDRLSRTYLRAR